MPEENEPMFDTRGRVRHERIAARAHIGDLAVEVHLAAAAISGFSVMRWDNAATVAQGRLVFAIEAVDAAIRDYLARWPEQDGAKL